MNGTRSSSTPVDRLPTEPETSLASGSEGTLAPLLAPERPPRVAGGPARMFSILGPVDHRRIELRNTTAPWRMVCALRIETARGVFNGTGWLAGPRTVITAGHCLHNDAFASGGGWARQVTVIAGQSWNKQPFGAVVSTRFDCAPTWLQGRERAHDIGAIHLDDPVGERVGWMKYDALDPAALARTTAVVSGYPEYAGSYEHLLVAKGAVRTSLDGRLYYEIDTTDGQSGGPVWIGDVAAPTVVAVHGYEADATPPAVGPGVNSGALLTPDHLRLIQTWQGG
ncbi:trypsin-like serine peptidase [Caulobacter soli]|uniref:trypsin-like serine peptidase n=1 Tax=Caulobacter soli TaxID=2708539 RepID=UPI0013E9BBDA|nr:trypsin-like serine protease [Caulobacter soli]